MVSYYQLYIYACTCTYVTVLKHLVQLYTTQYMSIDKVLHRVTTEMKQRVCSRF